MEVWQRKKLKNASFSAEGKCGKYFRVQTSGCATNIVGRNTWARLPVATQENHPAARGRGGQNIPIWRSCKRPPSGEAWVPLQILIDESVPAAILFLLDAAHCTPKENPADVFLVWFLRLQCCSLTVCKKQKQKSEWSGWYIQVRVSSRQTSRVSLGKINPT